MHAERVEHLGAQGLEPGGAAQPAHQLAEQREPDVGVVEAAAGTVLELWPAEAVEQVVGGDAGGALPPVGGRLGGQAGGVGHQLADGQVADLGAGQVPLEGVVEVEDAFVAQPHDDDGDHALGDGSDAVLGGGRRLLVADAASAAEPCGPPVADDRRRQRRHPALGLFDGQPAQQGARRRLSHLTHERQE
ncbi:hypothetical protein GCM10020001_106250 [Nonomuraea salmonea]